jgi:hypothetical protein
MPCSSPPQYRRPCWRRRSSPRAVAAQLARSPAVARLGALQALVNELKARGRDASMTGRPDIDGHPALTTDATMEIDGNEWAVDHCLVSREPDLPPAMAQAEKALSSRLQAITEVHKCGLAVSHLPQAQVRAQQARDRGLLQRGNRDCGGGGEERRD